MPDRAAAPWLYLASQSPRRRELLAQWGWRAELLLPDTEAELHALEALEAVQPHEAPARYVQRVTRLKLQAALQRLQHRGWPPGPVLCADTTVALGREILGKPADAAEAALMLQRLAGQRQTGGAQQLRRLKGWQADDAAVAAADAAAPLAA